MERNSAGQSSGVIKISYTSTSGGEEEVELNLLEKNPLCDEFLGIIQKIITLNNSKENKDPININSVKEIAVKKSSTKEKPEVESIEPLPYIVMNDNKQLSVELGLKKVSTLRKKYEAVGMINVPKDGELPKKYLRKQIRKCSPSCATIDELLEYNNEVPTFQNSVKTLSPKDESVSSDNFEPFNFDGLVDSDIYDSNERLEDKVLTREFKIFKTLPKSAKVLEDSIKRMKMYNEKHSTIKSNKSSKMKVQKIEAKLLKKHNKTETVAAVNENLQNVPQIKNLPQDLQLSIIYVKKNKKKEKKENKFKKYFKQKNKNSPQHPLKLIKEQSIQVQDIKRIPCHGNSKVEYHLQTAIPQNFKKLRKNCLLQVVLDCEQDSGELTDKSKAMIYTKEDDVNSLSHKSGSLITDNVTQFYKNRLNMGPKMRTEQQVNSLV